MKVLFKKHQGIRRAFYFFPLQLLLMTIKENLVFIFLWLIFFGMVTKAIGLKYGIPYLFLYPEYFDKESLSSYMLLGFSCGGFIMSFNVSSYIINSFRFPFLATLERPFFTFILNNCIIPVAFLVTYIFCEYHFAPLVKESKGTVTLHMVWFMAGVTAFMLLTIGYFYLFDRNMLKVFGIGPRKASKVSYKKEKVRMGHDMEWEKLTHENVYADRTWYIETYLGGNLAIRLARGYEHYSHRMLEKIFKQNHQTGAVFEIVAIISLLLIGLFRDNPFLMVPAGASIFLLFTIFTMLVSAIHNFFRGWTTVVVVGLLFLLNYFSSTHWQGFAAKAYGLNYNTAPAPYSFEEYHKLNSNPAMLEQDRLHMEGILDLWKAKNQDVSNNYKPPFIIINTSGGGLRSATWTYFTLRYLDSVYNGELYKRVELITGSSGGLIGAAYYRELYLEKQQGKDVNPDDTMHIYQMSQDLLNPIAFTIATNDVAFRLQRFHDGDYTYTKDRGFAFEEKLDENTNNALNKRLRDYRLPEEQALIPLMIVTPTIVNDGRKLLISPQGLSFMTDYDIDTNFHYLAMPQSIEFSRLFKQQDAQNLRFTSALRMSATFPYITPITALPSNPPIEAMDAGLVDNFGLEEAVRYVFSFRDWLEKNVSRVIIIQIRDQDKQPAIQDNSPDNLIASLTFPVNRFYSNLFPVENYKEDRMLEYMSHWYTGKVDVVYFQIDNKDAGDISLSWHLTEMEKEQVKHSMNQQDNKNSISWLKRVLR